VRRSRRVVPATLAILLAIPVVARAAGGVPEVRVETRGSAPGPAPDAGEAVAEVLRGATRGSGDPALADRLAAHPRVRAALSAAIAFLRSADGDRASLDVRVERGPRRTVVRIAYVRNVEAPVGPAAPESGPSPPVAVTLGETQLVLERPPSPSAAPAPPPPPPTAADAVPLRDAPDLPCPPGDAECWDRTTRAALAARPLACEAYAAEADRHVLSLAGFADPNLSIASPPPDLDEPGQVRDRRAAALSGPLPDGLQGSDPLADPLHARLANGPPGPVGPPGEPTDGCRAEWDAGRLVPTPWCTRDVVAFDRWARSAASTMSRIPAVRPLPGVSQWIGMRALADAQDVSWEGVFAARWIDRLQARLDAGDDRYVDTAAEALAADADARRLVAPRLRRWYSDPAATRWREAIRTVYREHFLALYPEAAEPGAGLPAFDRFPARTWWVTNWLASVARRGIPAAEAVERLKCRPDAGRALAALADLLPGIADAHPRLAPVAAAVRDAMAPGHSCR